MIGIGVSLTALPQEHGSAPAEPVAPANTAVPTISGTPEVGQTLTATSTGTWTGTPPPGVAVNWQRDEADIPGATASAHVLQAADEGASVRLRATATNTAGSATAYSTAVSVAAAPSGAAYYVRSGGSDAADGSTATPWATIAHALTQLDPGDTLLVGDGTWTTPFTFGVSGSAGKPITIKAENLQQASIEDDGYAAIIVTGNYVTIDGLRITNPNRHGIEGQFNHHMTVKNCLVEDCGGNGIGALGGDFYHFEGNTCRRNGRTGWNSGISVYQPDHWITKDEATTAPERNVFRNNLVYENRMLSFIDFDTGSVEVVAGDSVTVAGVLIGKADRIELTSGSWGAGTAAGRIGILRDVAFGASPTNSSIISVGGSQVALTTGGDFYTDEGMFTDGNGLILDDWGWYQKSVFVVAFTGGSTTPLAEGNTVVVGAGGESGTVSGVWLESGSWAGGNAAGRLRIDFGSAPTNVATGTQILVGGVQRALTSGSFTQYGYPYGALVDGNISALNGGKGIQCYGVLGTALVRNNTAWHNNRDGAQIGDMTWRGEITAQDSAPTFVNNIAVADTTPDVNIGTFGLWQVAGSVLASNLTHGASINANVAWTDSGGNQLGTDPHLTDPAAGDYRVASNSAAVDAGTAAHGFAATDRNGDGRTSATINLGALEAVGPPWTTPPASSETLFGATLSPSSTVTDEDIAAWTAYMLGIVIKPAVDGRITHIRWYKHAGDDAATRAVGLWSSGGTLLGSGESSTPTTGWNDVPLVTSIAVTAGTLYVPSVEVPKPCDYAIIAGLGDADTTNGNITAPDNAEAGGQGRFKECGVGISNWVFPSSSFGNSGYGVDVVFEAD